MSSGGTSSGGTSSGGTGGTDSTYCESAEKAALPVIVTTRFIASGFQGDPDPTVVAIPEGVTCPSRPSSPVGQCVVFDYTPVLQAGWGGVNWQYPENNWGSLPGLCIADGAASVSFSARGNAGGEAVDFWAAGVSRHVVLTTEWQSVTIDVSSVDYNRTGALGGVTQGFGFSMTAGSESSYRIFIDDIRWE
jgi:hypothetical protein